MILHAVEKETRFIFSRIPQYVSGSETTRIFDARNRSGELIAFDVAEFSARHYAMYMFNFCSRDRYIPGASDLLLFELIREAKAENKRYINLGLGIDPGGTFFKRKWGGVPFVPYASCSYQCDREAMFETLLQKL
jgi:hypothetical protein